MTNEATTEIVERAPDSVELQSIATEDLRRELVEAIGLTVRTVQRVAAIWAELERRGEDLSDIRFSLAAYMPAVAAGRLLPEVVVALSGRQRTLNIVADLAIDDQRRLINGEPITLVTTDATVQRSLDDMTFSEITRVIRDGQIRTEAEQRLAMDRLDRRRRQERPRRGRRPTVRVLQTSDQIKIGDTSVDIEDVIAALRGAGYLDQPK